MPTTITGSAKRNATTPRATKSKSSSTDVSKRQTASSDDSNAALGTHRSIWKGAISFGLVTIPVHMVSATEDRDVAFHLLHEKCSTRLKQMRWCPTCKLEVAWNDTVRGYEYAKGLYVRMTAEDFDSIPSHPAHTIELSSFVKLDEIDPLYFEKSYFLEPEETGVKPFALLIAALEKKGLTGIGSIAIRERERLCALRALNGALVLETLYYADEVREYGSDKAKDVSKSELDIALKLIDMLTNTFRPEQYHDQYREAVLSIIEDKVSGKEVISAPEPEKTRTLNLMDALRASLKAIQSQGDSPNTDAATKRTENARARKSA